MRLCLVVWNGVTDLQWSDSWNRYLGDALLESTLPQASRSFLRSRGVGIDGEGLSSAEQALAVAHRAFERRDWRAVELALTGQQLDVGGKLLRARSLRGMGSPEAFQQIREARSLSAMDPVAAHEAALDEAAWWVEDGEIARAIESLEEALTRTRAPLRVLQLLDARHALRADWDDNARARAEIQRAGAATVARDPVLLRRLITWIDDGDLLQHALVTLGLDGSSTEALDALGIALGEWEARRRVTRGPSKENIETRKVFEFLRGEFNHDELRQFIGECFPEVRDSIPWGQPVQSVAFEIVQQLRMRGLVGEVLHQALRAARPRRAHEIDALWHVSAFRGSSDDVIRTIQKLSARDGGLNGDVAEALRRALLSQRSTAEGGLHRLNTVLALVWPDESRLRQVARFLALPLSETISLNIDALVASADAAGILDRLVAYAESTERGFSAQIAEAWIGVLAARQIV